MVGGELLCKANNQSLTLLVGETITRNDNYALEDHSQGTTVVYSYKQAMQFLREKCNIQSLKKDAPLWVDVHEVSRNIRLAISNNKKGNFDKAVTYLLKAKEAAKYNDHNEWEWERKYTGVRFVKLLPGLTKRIVDNAVTGMKTKARAIAGEMEGKSGEEYIKAYKDLVRTLLPMKFISIQFKKRKLSQWADKFIGDVLKSNSDMDAELQSRLANITNRMTYEYLMSKAVTYAESFNEYTIYREDDDGECDCDDGYYTFDQKGKGHYIRLKASLEMACGYAKLINRGKDVSYYRACLTAKMSVPGSVKGKLNLPESYEIAEIIENAAEGIAVAD
jgi:tetratricopeptide (TPR) repeat protein